MSRPKTPVYKSAQTHPQRGPLVFVPPAPMKHQTQQVLFRPPGLDESVEAEMTPAQREDIARLYSLRLSGCLISEDDLLERIASTRGKYRKGSRYTGLLRGLLAFLLRSLASFFQRGGLLLRRVPGRVGVMRKDSWVCPKCGSHRPSPSNTGSADKAGGAA